MQEPREVRFIVEGEPVAQGRPRFTTMGGYPRAYDPPKSKAFKKKVRQCAERVKPDALIDIPVEVEIIVYRSSGMKSMSKRNKTKAESGEILPQTKPDVDNYIKGVLDGMSGVIYEDDKLITDISCKKRFSEKPRVEITVRGVAYVDDR